MTRNKLTPSLALFALALAATSAPLHAADKEPAALLAKAKITKAQAKEIALKKAPNGKIKEAELEEEKGQLIWSFDLTTPGHKDITEVNVDAITGAVTVHVENAKEEAREAKEEKKK